MGLFDKKYCDICGEKIGLLGNRKLEDGNLCKNCAAKLSPFFSERRRSTVEDIKRQLAYREENEKLVRDFNPDVMFDGSKKVYISTASEAFIVTGSSNWRSTNPDIIKLSQVVAVDTNIKENREEIFFEDSDGNRKSYQPPRYECDYEFDVVIRVNSPWFDSIELEISDGSRPDSPYTDLYREYERKMNELKDILLRRDNRYRTWDGDGMMNRTVYGGDRPSNPAPGYAAAPAPGYAAAPAAGYAAATSAGYAAAPAPGYAAAPAAGYAAATSAGYAAAPAPQQQAAAAAWMCPSCGAQNTGKFCANCGSLKPASVSGCPNCGWSPAPGQAMPKFCPECGKPLA